MSIGRVCHEILYPAGRVCGGVCPAPAAVPQTIQREEMRMEKQVKVSPAVTLEAVTVPLADGQRGVVLVLTDDYSRKTVMRAMPASR